MQIKAQSKKAEHEFQIKDGARENISSDAAEPGGQQDITGGLVFGSPMQKRQGRVWCLSGGLTNNSARKGILRGFH